MRRRLPVVLSAVVAVSCSDSPLPVGRDGPLDAAVSGRIDGHVLDATTDGRRSLDASDTGPLVRDAGDGGFGLTFDGGNVPSSQLACLQGTSWSWCNPQPTGVTLDGVWGSGASDVWAVGAGGVVEHWNGTVWSVVPSPTTLELFSVWGTSPVNAWAVGSNAHGDGAEKATSVILHWDGTSWTVSQSVAASELWSVWGSGATDVWAVGASDPGSALLMHWDGTSWMATSSTAATVLYGVRGSATNDVWAVGNGELRPDASTGEGAGSYVPQILHWDGSSWTVLYDNGGAASSSLPLSVWVGSTEDAWVATSGAPLHWDGIEWLSVTLPMTATGPTSFGGIDGSNLWGTLGGTMDEWTGSSWSSLPVDGIGSPGTQPLTLSSVWASSSTNAWAVGLGGSIAHFDGSVWSIGSAMPALLSACASTTSDGWAVGETGIALHWNGSTWSPTNTGTRETITAAWAAAPSDVWTLAADSTVRRWHGTAWSTSPAPTTNPLAAIGGTSSSDVWISSGWVVGDQNPPGDSGASGLPPNNGLLSHWDGIAWTNTTVPLDGGMGTWMQAIWARTSTDVWAVGFSAKTNALTSSTGVVAHWDGATWTPVDTPFATGSTIATAYASVWGSSASDVWASGSATGSSNAVLIHWNGATWTDATLAGLQGAGAVWGSGPDDVWMWAFFTGTAEESLVHWNGSAWSTSLTLPDVWSYGNAITGTGPLDLWAVGSGGIILHHR